MTPWNQTIAVAAIPLSQPREQLLLNAGLGDLVVGVHEKKGAFERFEPMNGDRDILQRRITSIIQDNVDPKPLGVRVEFLDLDTAGFIL